MSGVVIPNNPFWQPKLGVLGETVTALKELEQAIHIIIQTPRGAVPLDPEFGCDLYKHIDKPEPTAIQAIIRAIARAIKYCEPRITLGKIRVNNTAYGRKTLTIDWTPTDAWQTPFALPEAQQGATIHTEVAL